MGGAEEAQAEAEEGLCECGAFAHRGFHTPNVVMIQVTNRDADAEVMTSWVGRPPSALWPGDLWAGLRL